MIWFAPISLLLAAIDMLRMKRTWGKVNNINHWPSYLFAAIGITALYFFVKPHSWYILTFVIGCIAIRGILYDVSLNMLVNFFIIPRAIDYISSKSNSLNEDRLTKIPFWWRRFGFAGLLLIVLLINQFFL